MWSFITSKMTLSNLHTHTLYSDGAAKPEQYIAVALKKNFDALGFSEHAVLSEEFSWAMKKEDETKYIRHINKLKQKFNNIRLFVSLEMDYIPGRTVSFSKKKAELGLDYVIGSIHLVKNPQNNKIWFIDGPQKKFDASLKEVFNNDIKTAVETYFVQSCQMIEEEKPDFIAHCDKVRMNNAGRYFKSDEKWYQALNHELLRTIKKHNTILEINTRGLYKKRFHDYFPSEQVIRKAVEMDIPLKINSDAHAPDELDGFFNQARKFLKEIKAKEVSLSVID